MPINIDGITISGNTASGIAISPGLTFNSQGYSVATALPGYSGFKSSAANWLLYSGTSGWEINNARWSGGGLNTTNGVFTCPVAGYYAVGFNGIANGGSNWDDGTSYGYAGFAKNGALSYFIHWNLVSGNAWDNCGGSSIFQCAAGDTLAFFINRSPSPVGSAQTYGRGWYPDDHHAVWCVLVG